MSLKEYIPGAVIAVVTGFEAVLTHGFIVSNRSISDAAAFSFTTISMSSIATLFGLGGFLLSLPRFKESLKNRGISTTAYTLLVGGLLFLSVALAIVAIYSGSLEYTQFQSISS